MVKDLKAKVLSLEAQLEVGNSGKGETIAKLPHTRDHAEVTLNHRDPSLAAVNEQFAGERFAAG